MRKPHLWALVVVAGVAGAARAADAPVVSLEQFVPDAGLSVARTPDGMQIGNKKPGEVARLTSPKAVKTPLVITARVKTSKNNIRLFYGDHGALIFDWEVNGTELRFHDPRTGQETPVANKGAIPKNEFVTIEWSLDAAGSRVSVDGVERYVKKGDFSDLTGNVAIGTFDGSVLTLKSLSVRQGKPAEFVAGDGVPFNIAVPCAAPTDQNAPAAAAPPATSPDADLIERPEFSNAPKALAASLSSISVMTVLRNGDGDATGTVEELLAVVPPQSRRGDTAGVGFVRAQNDKMMQTSFEEALRAVTLRYPLWQPGHIDVSFRDKFTPVGGPSAGTAFAVLVLSTLEGFKIDPNCAITGDISVDWKTVKVGGVALKLRGAFLDKRSIAIIPAANADILSDMAIRDGLPSVYNVQVFSAATLQQAVAVARADRPTRVAEAVAAFAELQAALRKAEAATLKSPATAKTLQHVLDLAPNHASARYLLDAIQGTAPRTLSISASLYEVAHVLAPYADLLTIDDKTVGVTVPPTLRTASRRRLDALRPIVHKDLAAVVRDIGAFTEVANHVADRQTPVASLRPLLATLLRDLNTVTSDQHFIEQYLREGI